MQLRFPPFAVATVMTMSLAISVASAEPNAREIGFKKCSGGNAICADKFDSDHHDVEPNARSGADRSQGNSSNGKSGAPAEHNPPEPGDIDPEDPPERL